MTCLQCWFKEIGTKDNFSCRVCEKICMSRNESSDFHENNYIRMVEKARILSGTDVSNLKCDTCPRIEADDAIESIAKATHYCFTCPHNLCSRCTEHHSLQRSSTSHQVVPFGELRMSAEYMRCLKEYCNLHLSEEVNIFCIECSVPVCVICYDENHRIKDHKCCGLHERVGCMKAHILDRLKEMEYLVDDATRQVTNLKKIIEYLKIRTMEIQVSIVGRGEVIRENREQRMSRYVQEHVVDLCHALSEARDNACKEFEDVIEKYRTKKSRIGRLMKYLNEVLANATPFHIACMFDVLTTRAKDLIQLRLPEIKRVDIHWDPSDVTLSIVNEEEFALAGKFSVDKIHLESELLTSVGFLTYTA